MPQVSVRDSREDDRAWIQSVYRDYLLDLAPSATGLYPMLGAPGQREPDPAARPFADANAHVLTVCYAEERAGFAKINVVMRPRPAAAAAPAGAAAALPAALPGAPSAAPPASRAPTLPEFSMAEFFITRPWRRRGIGSQAVRLILDRFTGHWLITEHLRNDTAVRFWRHVVMTYTAGAYQERIVNGEVQQRFVSGNRRAGRS